MIKTFISHTSSDHPFVEWLKTKLERETLGLDIFVDDGSVSVGDDPQEMINEVRRSVIFIPVLSNESVQKEFVKNEIRTAFNNETTHIFPIRLKCDDANIPEDIRTKFKEFDKVEGKIYEDFSDEREWVIHYENLRRAIFNKIVELGFFKEDTKDFYQDCEHLDLILQRDEPTILEIKSVIDVYLKKEAYKRYFFSKLTNMRWLKYLKMNGYLRANPQPIEDVDSPGLFRIPQWDVLVYLERVSSQAEKNDEVINDLLDIIKSVTSLKDTSGQHIDNYRTWWYFVKILLNIPTEKIPIEIIELIPIWLDSSFYTSSPGNDIATKLLPKFLDSDASEDWKKAEKIVEFITDIKWSFNAEEKKEEARTVIDSYWLLESFKKNAEKTGKRCSPQIIYTIADRLKEIFRKERGVYWDEVEYHGNKYRIDISSPDENKYLITVGLIKKEAASREEQTYEAIRGGPESAKLLEFSIENCSNEKEFIETVKHNLISYPTFVEINDKFSEKIRQIYNSLFEDYSYIWFPSLYDQPDTGAREAKETLTSILRAILLSKAESNVEQTKEILNKFLSGEYKNPLFRRMVLFVIGNAWEAYQDIFIEMINGKDRHEYFNGPNYVPELYELLKRNHEGFSKDVKDSIMDIIEEGPKDPPEENRGKYIAYWKQKWSLLLKSDPKFEALYNEQRKIVEIPEEEIRYKSTTETWRGPGSSPLTKEEILKLSNVELALGLKEFRTKDRSNGPTVGGLAEGLKEAVKEKPKKFVDDLSPFKDTGFTYVYKILNGIRDAWNEKKVIAWAKVFTFVSDYIDRDAFWDDEFIVEKDGWLGEANHLWVVGAIAELIQDGTKDDEWAFSSEHFEEAQKIIFMILDKLSPDEEKEISDYVFHALNSSLGKTITALIYLALRIARVRGIKEEIKWSVEIKSKYDEILGKRIIEAFTLLGRYLPSLYYLDKKWVKGKIESLETEKGSRYWEAFMDGYLSIGKLYENIYDLLRSHYEYGVGYDFKQKHNGEHLVQHIAIAYLRGQESIEDPDSLFRRMMDSWSPDQINEIIGFFWMQSNYLKDEPDDRVIKGRIISFWKWVYENKIKGKSDAELTGDEKIILGKLAKLTAFLPKINEEYFEWLMISAPYVNESYDSSFVIEYLNNYDDSESMSYVGKIFLRMLESFTPDYRQEHIRSVVEKLYSVGQKEDADAICDHYGKEGYEFLRDIWEKYNAFE